MAGTASPFSRMSRRRLLSAPEAPRKQASNSDHKGPRALRLPALVTWQVHTGEPPCPAGPCAVRQRAPFPVSPTQLSGAQLTSYLSASVRERGTANTVSQLWMEHAFQKCGTLWAAVVLRSSRATGWLLKEVSCASDLSAESGQGSGQFQGRPSEVWSQWQSQHHGQQSGEQQSHQQPGQTEVFQVNQRAPPSRRYRRLSLLPVPLGLCLPATARLPIETVSAGPSQGR